MDGRWEIDNGSWFWELCDWRYFDADGEASTKVKQNCLLIDKD